MDYKISMQINSTSPTFEFPLQSTETIDAFNASNYEDFDRVVQFPMTLHDIEQKIHNGQYRTTEEFTADFKWILHNCYIYFSTCYTSPSEMGVLLKIAKSLLKTCKQEMGQIETCAECYANANTKKSWFIEVCDPPHVLLWAKLKGFPYWPAKAMAVNGATLVDVRFFGAHDRAWVPVKDCYLYSQHNPNVYKLKNTSILQCIKEIEQHIAKVRQKFGSFEYGAAKEKYDPLRHQEQLQKMVPGYHLQPCGVASGSSSSVVSSSSGTTTNSGENSSTDVSPQKTNLTYKIIKTGDNSCLISPVVKENKNGKSAPVTAAVGKALSPDQSSSASAVAQREAIKPTKIVIKNTNGEKNKQYELVTPTDEKEQATTLPVVDETEPDAKNVLKLEETTEMVRKVDSVVVKRKSEKWKKLSMKRGRGGVPEEPTVAVVGAAAQEAPSVQATTTMDATNTTTTTNNNNNMKTNNNSNNNSQREMKRRNTEEVTSSKATATVSGVPSRIKIRRVTRASSRPPVEEEMAVEAKDEEEELGIRGENCQVETTENKTATTAASSDEKEEKSSTLSANASAALAAAESVVEVRLPITTVKDVLDQLPQISIVPSRKNSVTGSRTTNATGGGTLNNSHSSGENSRLSSRSSSKSSNRGATDVSPAKTSPTKSSSVLAPENLQVKIEPISDDEVEITSNGLPQARGQKEREKSVEIVEDQRVSRGSVSLAALPRARKTFLRNIGSRPQPPTFNAATANNMVLIPREMGAEAGQGTSGNTRRRSPVHMLSGTITQSLASAVTNMISHGPPRLVRKPNGTMQGPGDDIFPSEAGSSCRILMENAHRMTDFFRSVIEDTLSDMADKGCLEAKVQLLQLELEQQKYNHQRELQELKSNTGEWERERGIE